MRLSRRYSIVLNKKKYSIIINKSNRKSIALKIDLDSTIILNGPIFLSDTEFLKFVEKNSDKVVSMLNRTDRLHNLKPFTNEEKQKMVYKCEKVIKSRSDYFAPIVGVKYNKITIRSQKTRWGSCSSNGNLSFNCLLSVCPPKVLDSVVVHELCHLLYMNHTKDFYREVYRVFPEYDTANNWLKVHGKELIYRMHY